MDMSLTTAADAEDRHNAKLIDLRKIAATIRRRIWWVAGTAAIVLALTIVAYMLSPSRFSATASVALDRNVTELVAQGKTANDLPADSSSVDTEVEVLTSPTLMGEVADQLGLAKMRGFGMPEDGHIVSAEQARRTAIKRLMGGLDVKRTGTSYAINVSYVSPDPVLSANVVNTVVDQYVDDQRNKKVGARARETQLLRERLQKLRGDVISAESAVARYRAATNLVTVQKDSTAVQQELSVLNTQLATAQADLAAARARQGAGAGATDTSATLGALRSQQAQLSAQRAELAGRYGRLHPDLARVDRQLNDVNASIGKETARVRQSLAADAQVAAGRTAAIGQSLARAQGSLVAGNNASVQLNELERNAESSRALYQSLLDRYREAVAGQGTERSNAYVIAHAIPAGVPSFPNRTVFAVAGILASLIAAGGVVLVLELLESGLQSRQEVESKLGLPVVGTIPDLRTVPGIKFARRDALGPADYLVGNPTSVFGEAFRSIRTALHLGAIDRGVRSIAVCSALPDEGKTTTAICLARSAAMSGQRTVLVDCDLRRRALSRTMAASATIGLTDVLNGTVSIDDALVVDQTSGAWILPQGDGKAGYDLITQPAMQALIRSLSERFDLVVLDTAPVLPLAEARAVAAMTDGVLLGVRWRKTPVHASELAVDLLGRAGARVLGVAMTRVNLKQLASSGGGDEMVYYKQFKHYYT